MVEVEFIFGVLVVFGVLGAVTGRLARSFRFGTVKRWVGENDEEFFAPLKPELRVDPGWND